MDFEYFLDKLISLDNKNQKRFLEEYSDYNFSENELFEIFQLISEDNYGFFCYIFKDKISNIENGKLYGVISQIVKNDGVIGNDDLDIQYYYEIFLWARDNMNYLSNYYISLFNVYMINNIKYTDKNYDEAYNQYLLDVIKKNRDVNFNQVEFIIKKILKDKGLLYLCNDVKLENLKDAYGDMRLILYMMFRTKCNIKINLDKIKKDSKNYMDMIYMLFYVIFHEIEHVNQVRFMLTKNNYGRMLSKKLAILYRHGFFIEQRDGHGCIDSYNSLTIEYGAKMVGMIECLKYIEDNFSDIFDVDFMNNRKKEICSFIKDNKNSIFNIGMDNLINEYKESVYLSRLLKSISVEEHIFDYKYFNDDFLNEQFFLLLLGRSNAFEKVIDKNSDMKFDDVIYLLSSSQRGPKR